MNVPRLYATATPLGNGKVLIAGGSPCYDVYGTPGLASAELYDTASGTFTVTGTMATPRIAALAITLLLGGCVGAPAILALSYANYSNRGPLLLWTKSLQLAIFLVLSIVLIPRLGPLGAAIALVSSDIIAQFGVLFVIIAGETLKHPVRHTLFLVAMMVTIVAAGVTVGAAIKYWLPGTGITHFMAECVLWLVAVALLSSPLANKPLRNRLIASIPR